LLQDKDYLAGYHTKLARPGNPSVLRLLRYPPLPPAEGNIKQFAAALAAAALLLRTTRTTGGIFNKVSRE